MRGSLSRVLIELNHIRVWSACDIIEYECQSFGSGDATASCVGHPAGVEFVIAPVANTAFTLSD